MSKKNSIRYITGIISFLYFFFPIAQYLVVYNSSTMDRSLMFEDYYVFILSSTLFGLTRYAESNMLIPLLVQFVAFIIAWWLLCMVANVLWDRPSKE